MTDNIASVRQYLTGLRRSIADRIVLVLNDEVDEAGLTFRADTPLVEMVARMEQTAGGVLCGHASVVFWRALFEQGYAACTVHFGFETPAKFTHVGVLVRLDDKHYYYDPYFNFEFVDPFEDAIGAYKSSGTINLLDDGHGPRRTYLGRPLLGARWDRDGWRFTQPPTKMPIEFPSIVMGAFGRTRYSRQLQPYMFEELARWGLAPRFESIFLFPYAVHTLETGYVDEPRNSQLLEHLIRVTGCRGRATHSAAICHDQKWHPSFLLKEVSLGLGSSGDSTHGQDGNPAEL